MAGSKGAAELQRQADNRSRWVMAKPLVGRVDPDAVAGLVRAATGLMVKDFVSDDPKDLAPYGLDKPLLTVTLCKEAKPPAAGAPFVTTTLRFGGPADPQKLTAFMLTDDGKHVVTVDAAAVKNLDKSPETLRDKHVLAADMAKAARIQLKLPAKLSARGQETEFELVKADKGWQVASAGRTDKADPAAVEGLLRELADLRVLYFAEGETAPLAKSFAPAGSVRLTVEGAAAPAGFEIDAAATLVKNLHEDWVGRINEVTLKSLRKDWLDYLNLQVLAVDEGAVTGLAIQTPDRKEVFCEDRRQVAHDRADRVRARPELRAGGPRRPQVPAVRAVRGRRQGLQALRPGAGAGGRDGVAGPRQAGRGADARRSCAWRATRRARSWDGSTAGTSCSRSCRRSSR